MKRWQKIWAGPPPLIWRKSKRTATFFREAFPKSISLFNPQCLFVIACEALISNILFIKVKN